MKNSDSKATQKDVDRYNATFHLCMLLIKLVPDCRKRFQEIGFQALLDRTGSFVIRWIDRES